MNEYVSDEFGGQTPQEQTLQNAIQLYAKVRVQAARRLSFAPRGDNGLPDASGRISSHLLSETFDGVYQRVASVLQLLVEHSELPDTIHELSSSESSESRLAGTICTALFTWMLADVSELLTGGDLHTVGPMMQDMIANVGDANISASTSLKNRPATLLSQSMKRLKTDIEEVKDQEKAVRPNLKDENGKKRTGGSRTSSSKSPKGKKRRSVKKKSKKSKNRSGRKKRS